jgi:NADP-dependent 3-hydroxy acid dehydrogenase YdfG
MLGVHATIEGSNVENNIQDKVIVITGASSGLGEATAQHLASLGAIVVLGARRVECIEALAHEIKVAGGQALAVQTDVTDHKQVQALVDAAIAHYGRVDVMLNNAGLMPHSPLDRLKIDDWDRMIDVNIKGVMYGIAAVLPHMIDKRSGHIINVSSVAGHKVRTGSVVYSATKHAVRVISEGLRQEVKPHGLRTTIISPGAVDTELPNSITEADVAEGVRKFYEIAISPTSFARAVAYAIGQPDDVDINEILFRPTQQEY